MARRVEKLQQLDPRELELQERELGEQVFRLRFQLATGQAEGLKRLREVRRDLALVFRRDKALSRAALAFIDIAVKHKSTEELAHVPSR